MNLKITHSWLTEFLKTSVAPQKLADSLSLCGPSFESVEKINSDYLYDIEITTNRVDMMSVLGIAKEASAILPRFKHQARFKPPQLASIQPPSEPLPLTIKDPQKHCQRILAVVLDNLKLKPSTPKIANRLKSAGIRSLNNIIDITNYVMTEIGHPTHVFDYDRIKSHQLIFRKSKKGETVTTLENKTYSLPGGDIVIDDGTGTIIDLPGIIGTQNSVVTNATQKIIFFLETNDPVSIRNTAMTLGIRTMAATLNEKWVDPELALTALKRGVKLFQDLAGAKIASNLIDIYPQPPKPKTISIKHQLITSRLGIQISPKEVKKILQSLDFKSEYQLKNKTYQIQVPSFRQHDINLPEDIVEEVARIYGYHRLPSKLMATSIPTDYPDQNFELEQYLKTILSGFGLNEIYTNSLISAKLAKQSSFPLKSHLKIKNALSKDWQYLRRSLIPSHLEALNQPSKNLTFFEIAHTYHPVKNNLPEEKLQLIISTKKSYLFLKGVLEALLTKLHLQIEFKPQDTKALINLNNQQLGFIGPSTDNPQIYVTVIELKPLLKKARLYPEYQPVSPHQPIIEDLTFTLPEKTYLEPVLKTIKKSHQWVKKVELTKTYHQNYTFNITYQSSKSPLSDKKIAPIRKKIVSRLKSKHRAQLVGRL